MSCEWAPEYCLACDRQTDGSVYCSESCRLADYERTSTPSSAANSPAVSQPSSWSASATAAPRQPKFYLSPAYDFSNPTPYGTTPQPQSFLASYQTPASLPTNRRLSPSNSHSSLCSMQSSSSTSSETRQLSEKATRELREYASSFEQVRSQRRRSY